MKMLQRTGLHISSAFLALAASTHVAFAQFLGPVPNIGGGSVNIRTTILNVLSKVLTFMALVAVVVIVVAGIRLVVAGSDEGQRDKAKNMILYAVIGLIVIILASAIVNFVAETLNV